MLVRFSAGPLARLHIAYRVQAHASMQLLTEIVDKQDSARRMAARVAGISSRPGWSREVVDTRAAFALAILRSKWGTTEAHCAEAPKREGHVPTDAR